MPEYCISGLTVGIDAPEWMLHENLTVFLCQNDKVYMECKVCFVKYEDISVEKSDIIVTTPTKLIYESQGFIHYTSNSKKDIPYDIIANSDWSVCTMLLDPEYNNPDDEENVRMVKDCIFASLRRVMIAALSHRQGLMVHSSSIIFNDMGILFSAPMGTGKSTHAHLWKQKYGTEILDGDVNTCRILDGRPYAFGLPWCGTSGEFVNRRVPLKAIVFLQQSKENRIRRLDLQEAFMRLVSRSFLLPFNEKMTDRFLDIALDIAGSVECYLLDCLPNYEAVELVKKCLEKN